MASRRVLKSVLRNFLGTYTSRYSDYHGYWLFGFLVENLTALEFHLLNCRPSSQETPLDVAMDLAAVKFADQLEKSGLDATCVREARLRIERSPEMSDGSEYIHIRRGYSVRFLASATSDMDRCFECKAIVFVAPHDPRMESRSAGAM